MDPNRDFPRTGTQDWRSVSQQGSSNLGAPSFQTPLPGPTNVSNNQPQWQPNYNPSNPSGTLANTPLLNPPQAPNFNGNPAYSNGSWTTGQGWNNSALAQNNAATNGSIPVSTPTTYLPNSNPLNLPAWVRSQGPNASSNAGQELAATIRRTNYTPTTSGTSLGTSAGGSTTGNSSTDSSGSSSTRPVSSSSGSITPRGSLDEEREPPQDTSVLALGMLFLSIGLNVYFGYLIRGFYLKTRQLARDLRESILTT